MHTIWLSEAVRWVCTLGAGGQETAHRKAVSDPPLLWGRLPASSLAECLEKDLGKVRKPAFSFLTLNTNIQGWKRKREIGIRGESGKTNQTCI